MSSRAPLEITYDKPSAQPALRKPHDWQGFSAEYVELASDMPYDFKSCGESHYLALHDVTLRDSELRIDGLSKLSTRDLRDTITFVPKGCGIEGWCAPDARRNNFIAMYFDPEAIREDVGARYAQLDPAPFAYARNAPLSATLKKLGALVREPMIDTLHAESLSLLASLEIFGVVTVSHGRLSDHQISSVTDYVESHLSETISLSDLANIAGLSRFHFSRAFKAATGENPHAFVQKRRICRAAEMLLSSELSIEAIAIVAGYKGAPQFRRAFHEVMGVRPSKYRTMRR